MADPKKQGLGYPAVSGSAYSIDNPYIDQNIEYQTPGKVKRSMLNKRICKWVSLTIFFLVVATLMLYLIITFGGSDDVKATPTPAPKKPNPTTVAPNATDNATYTANMTTAPMDTNTTAVSDDPATTDGHSDTTVVDSTTTAATTAGVTTTAPTATGVQTEGSSTDTKAPTTQESLTTIN